MSPERAAEVLGVDVGAEPHIVTGAFAARARRTHPDVDGGSADAFREAVEARNVLLGRDRTRDGFRARQEASAGAPDGYIVFDEDPSGAAGGGSGVRSDEFPPWVVVPLAPSPALIAVGTGLLLISAFLSIYDVPYTWTIAEPITRWAILIAAAVAFAATGRRGFLIVMLVCVAVSLVVGVAITTIGGLLGLFVMMPAIVAINSAGFARRRRRAAGRGR
ncbi:J domain-containing protein [Labedella endophytica]|uniref:J domain-containing protein n=1 Tax=Labedella endophytica TaxID=1523160 RepID=A0A433JPH6_9MICO|nr:hypothetical protein [Labedella endophytica]RUQ98278.1 hypothetical protein ELQ94_14835 [Labedella endophytica]